MFRGLSWRTCLAGAVAGLGGAIAIGAMEWFSVVAHYPLVVIPFATSIVLRDRHRPKPSRRSRAP